MRFKELWPRKVGDFSDKAMRFKELWPRKVGDFSDKAMRFKELWPRKVGDFSDGAVQSGKRPFPKKARALSDRMESFDRSEIAPDSKA
ncbi:hypothetical protein [Methylocella tundrae]|nr:hypothetical protein [Methylocella tundrae]